MRKSTIERYESAVERMKKAAEQRDKELSQDLNKEKNKTEKERRRRIEILGGFVLDNLGNLRFFNEKKILEELDSMLTNRADRMLFNFKVEPLKRTGPKSKSPAKKVVDQVAGNETTVGKNSRKTSSKAASVNLSGAANPESKSEARGSGAEDNSALHDAVEVAPADVAPTAPSKDDAGDQTAYAGVGRDASRLIQEETPPELT